MSQVLRWREEAYATLRKAQELSSQAQVSLDKTHHFLAEEGVVKTHRVLERVGLAHDSHKECRQILGRLQEQYTAARKSYSLDVERLLPSLEQLHSVQAQLSAVEVPAFLLRENSLAKHLDDFISTAEIDHLRENIAVYQRNCSALITALDAHFQNIQTQWLAISKAHQALSSQDIVVYELKQLQRFYEEFGSGKKRPRKYESKAVLAVESALEQNSVLGQELGNLLEMLTNHYDQCSRALSWVQGNRLQEVDLAVLENDTLELPSVLREIHLIHDILLKNERNLKTVEPRGTASMLENCDSLLGVLAEFQSGALTKTAYLVAHFVAVFHRSFLETRGETPLRGYVQVLDQLTEHYRQFSRVYHVQYLSELHYEQYVYPRKFLKLIDELFNDKLLKFEDAERERRHAWLRRYGEYIPSSFQLPGDSEYPTVVQIISEGLDGMNTEAAEANESRLLALLKAQTRSEV